MISELVAQIRELTIAARGYRDASDRRADDDELIELGGGYDLWLGRLNHSLAMDAVVGAVPDDVIEEKVQ